jgi:hypothetical protein
MSRLDDALREALRREDPGPQFTARVLAQAAGASPKESWWRVVARLRWATAGALACLLLVGGGLEVRREQQVRQGRMAKEQLVLALHIAGAKLNLARDKVQELNAAE